MNRTPQEVLHEIAEARCAIVDALHSAEPHQRPRIILALAALDDAREAFGNGEGAALANVFLDAALMFSREAQEVAP